MNEATYQRAVECASAYITDEVGELEWAAIDHVIAAMYVVPVEQVHDDIDMLIAKATWRGGCPFCERLDDAIDAADKDRP
jgi:hypothetical protein